MTAEMPESVWGDPQTLLHGLVMVNQALTNYLTNIADVAEGVAVPYRAREIAALGNAMAEVGNALQGTMINSIPGDFITPPIFTTKQP